MRFLKLIFDFYLNASIHVALAVVALLVVSCQTLNIPINYSLLGVALGGTIVCYNFIKYGVEAEKYLMVSNLYHRIIQIFSFLCFGFAVYFLLKLEAKLWWGILILGLISSLYAVPLLPQTRNLRSLGGLKIFIVALVWSGFTIVLPVLDSDRVFDWDVYVLIFQRFILVLALLLPFEIRDLQWDNPELRTLPQVYGEQRTRQLGMILSVIFCLIPFLKDELGLVEILAGLFIALTLMMMFVYKGNMKKRYFASFWVESLPILWAILLWGLGKLL
ncbi:hypothetical protein [Flagellimonas flava]|uniref:UbiA prenyltransferase family protein n=1 Tax=Flagellimonas flava TaxID=570519 RepID=A0A1M5PV38_9FLAO|nr:hypothetical protein [Allomuricauda flava]SHH05530.1 hypothetical protein SAMN04488116_3374 [Allomuricauda flava]